MVLARGSHRCPYSVVLPGSSPDKFTGGPEVSDSNVRLVWFSPQKVTVVAL